MNTGRHEDMAGQTEDKEEDKPYMFEDAIALTGHGRFHYMLLICCGLCLTSVIITTLNTSYLLPSAACDFSMTAQDKGLLNAMCQIGIICSSHFWGYLADTRGRKKIIITGMVLDSFITIISSFSHAFWIFVVFKFFNGFAICASHAVNYAYLGEFHSTATRTKAIMLCGVFSSVATVTMPGLAWLVIPRTWSFQMPTYTYRTWRVFVVLTAIPGLLTSILYCLFPESPKFLLSQGKEQECIAVLRRIYSINTGKSPETYPVKRVRLVESLEVVSKIKKTNSSFVETMKSVRQQTVPLFRPPHLLHTVVCFIMMMSFFGVSYGLYMWLPEMFNNMSKFSELHPEESGSICVAYTKSGNATNNIIYDGFVSKLNETYSSGSSLSAGNHSMEEALASTCSSVVNPETFQNTLVVGGVSAVFFLLYGFIIDYIGKRTVLWLTLLGASGSGIALDFVSSSVAVVGFSCLVVSLLFTCISVLSAFIVDIFPTHLRGMAVSLSLMIGRIGIVAGSFVVGILLEVNCFSTFFLLGGIPLGCAFLTFFLPSNQKQPK